MGNHVRGIAVPALMLWAGRAWAADPVPVVPTHWDWCGWGGGGYMWTTSYHPTKPGVLYMGGDCAGVYKSEDDGQHWRMINNGLVDYTIYGMAVDPKSPDTVYAMAEFAGLCKSTDAGEHWQFIPGKDLWRSTDHGQTWQKLTDMAEGCIEGLEIDPRNETTIWFSTVKWGGTAWGHIMKTSDGGATWQDITGDIGYRKPAVLRFNPATNELWAGGVGLFKTRQ